MWKHVNDFFDDGTTKHDRMRFFKVGGDTYKPLPKEVEEINAAVTQLIENKIAATTDKIERAKTRLDKIRSDTIRKYVSSQWGKPERFDQQTYMPYAEDGSVIREDSALLRSIQNNEDIWFYKYYLELPQEQKEELQQAGVSAETIEQMTQLDYLILGWILTLTRHILLTEKKMIKYAHSITERQRSLRNYLTWKSLHEQAQQASQAQQ